MKKADKKALQEQLAAKQEEERIAARKRRLAAQKVAKELAEKDDQEQAMRCEILKNIIEKFNESMRNKIEYDIAQRKQQEWVQYLNVGTGPDPRNAPQLTTALHRWKMQRINMCDFSLAQKRDKEMHPILEVLDEIIRYPDDISSQQLKIYKEVCEEINVELMATLESATRGWVGNSCSELNEVRHSHISVSYRLALWFYIPLPSHMPRPQDPLVEPIELNFPELNVNITLPGKNNWRGTILRGLWVLEDRLSHLCASYTDPKPFSLTSELDLCKFNIKEYEKVCKLRTEQEQKVNEFYANIKIKIDALQATINEDKFGAMKVERQEMDKLNAMEPPAMMTPRNILIQEEADQVNAYLKSLIYKVDENEVNLRSHRPCGGILHLQLLQQPPRPKKMQRNITLTILEPDEKLRELVFQEIYNPPPPPAPGAVRTPEEIEADIRRQEAALERLFLINIELPETVLWLEPPIVCCWDSGHNKWVTDDIHDLKYNEDKFTIAFRTGQLRPIAFATYKYSNIPYQGWELKPNSTHTGVNITIMGAIIVCEFEVSAMGIKLKSLQNGATKALQDMVDQTFTLRKLMWRLQSGGVDFFPVEDAPNLIENNCLKLWVLEKHLYYCMAQLCTAFNFTWSRWNVSAGRRAIVQQIREYTQVHSDAFQILHVTPLQALLVTATEVSSEYSTEPLGDQKFCPDLYSLMDEQGGADAKALTSEIPWQLVENVKDLLCALKPCSYS